MGSVVRGLLVCPGAKDIAREAVQHGSNIFRPDVASELLMARAEERDAARQVTG